MTGSRRKKNETHSRSESNQHLPNQSTPCHVTTWLCQFKWPAPFLASRWIPVRTSARVVLLISLLEIYSNRDACRNSLGWENNQKLSLLNVIQGPTNMRLIRKTSAVLPRHHRERVHHKTWCIKWTRTQYCTPSDTKRKRRLILYWKP